MSPIATFEAEDPTAPEVIELGQPLGPEVLHLPSHPPFSYEMTLLHEREPMEPDQAPGSSAGTDRIDVGLHVGTHIDSLSHVAMDGRLCDGTEIFSPGVQSAEGGVRMRSGRGLRPIVAPGILLDLPGYLGCEVLAGDHRIGVEEALGCAEAAGVEIQAGSVVLFRTGFDLLWDSDPGAYLEPPFPGPEIELAKLLRERGVLATGSDTTTFEALPSEAIMAVHAELLVEGGIFILESLRLQELARRRIHSFEFIALPLNLAFATGSPLNPVAVLRPES